MAKVQKPPKKPEPPKKAKENPKPVPKTKEYYSVTMEVLVPAVLRYRIEAETPEEATEIAKKLMGQKQMGPPTINYARLRHLKAIVHNHGSSIIRYVKSLT